MTAEPNPDADALDLVQRLLRGVDADPSTLDHPHDEPPPPPTASREEREAYIMRVGRANIERNRAVEARIAQEHPEIAGDHLMLIFMRQVEEQRLAVIELEQLPEDAVNSLLPRNGEKHAHLTHAERAAIVARLWNTTRITQAQIYLRMGVPPLAKIVLMYREDGDPDPAFEGNWKLLTSTGDDNPSA